MRKFILIFLTVLLLVSFPAFTIQQNFRDGDGRRIHIDTGSLDAQAGATKSTTNSTIYVLVSVSVKLSASQTPTAVITVNSIAGTAFDYILLTQVFGASDTDLVFIPDNELIFAKGDEIDVNVSGAGGACTASVTIVTKPLI